MQHNRRRPRRSPQHMPPILPVTTTGVRLRTRTRGGRSRTESHSANFVSCPYVCTDQLLLTYRAGEKVRQQREESERNAENQRRAGGSYSTAEPEEVDSGEEGLPWGSISLRHVITAGRTKEQSSRESSIYAAASKAGGSSR